MQPELSGRGLFIFSDPGGAKPILSYLSLNQKITPYLVISDRVYDFYSDFNIQVDIYKEGSEFEIMDTFKPDFVFTGTSYTSKIELNFILAAKRAGIISYSFIDHYTCFLERFKFNNDYIFPDNTCVIDESAVNIAHENKLPGSILNTGNYYHIYLKRWKPKFTKKIFIKSIDIPIDNKIIVYAPDPLTNIGGKDVFGLDELTVWKALKDTLDLLKLNNYTIVIKFHPNQNQVNLRTLIKNSGYENIVFADNVHTNTLLFYADMIIGIFSNILIESLILGTPVIRCLNGLINTDPFAGKNVGQVVNTNEELRNIIEKNFNYDRR